MGRTNRFDNISTDILNKLRLNGIDCWGQCVQKASVAYETQYNIKEKFSENVKTNILTLTVRERLDDSQFPKYGKEFNIDLVNFPRSKGKAGEINDGMDSWVNLFVDDINEVVRSYAKEKPVYDNLEEVAQKVVDYIKSQPKP